MQQTAFIQDSSISPSSNDKNNNKTPNMTTTMIMLSRLLPYLATHNADNESLTIRTYALHAFVLPLSYSDIICNSQNEVEWYQILSKAVEIVETNFLSSWTYGTNAESSSERGVQEIENFSMEPSFLCVLLRLMSYLLPYLNLLKQTDAGIASHFIPWLSL